ncbi:hypothetical protein EI94DRAFT_861064 [Lactarius quietus]|nr:hypothetical protein EI94DRAFT_861064 [Lactarius quietus]
MRTIRSMASTSTRSGSVASGSRSTTFLPPVESIPDLSDFHSLSGSSAGSLSRQPSLRSRAVDDGAISNQTIIYPGDPRVIPPSRSSSLRRTTSMTDLGEEFESALRRAKDARPGLGFGLALVGEGSPVTVSSGPTLRRDVIVTPPPGPRGGGSRVRPTNPESLSSVSDDTFFTSGARTSGEPSTSYTVSSSSDTLFRARGTETGSAAPTEETSGSGTVVLQTYRGDYLDTLTDAPRSAFTSDSPSRATGLTRSRAIRTRRDAASSLSYSSSNLSGAESSSDRDNGSGQTPSRSYSDYSRGDGFSTLESYTRSSYSRSANGTPLPSSSSEHSPESEEDPITTPTPSSSTQYETARSPSIMSFASLPSIPSLYETAELCPTDSEATKSISSEDFITAKASAKAESVSDYITAPVCDSEPTSPYTTAEICPTEVSTEYDDAECRCKPEKVAAVSEGTQVTPPEPIQQVIRVIATQPVEEPVARAVDEEVQAVPEPVVEPVPIVLPPLVEEPVQVVPPPPPPTEVVIEVVPPQPAAEARETEIPITEPAEIPRARSPERYPELPITMMDPEFPPYTRPRDDMSSVSSPSDIGSIPTVSSVSRVSARNIPLPGSVSSPSLLAGELSSESSIVEPLRPLSTTSISSIPPSLPGPSPIARPDTLPTTTLLSTVTESTPSTITPSRRSAAASSRVSSSPSIRSSQWPAETDDTYESSILRASPSVQSVAFPEGPDISFDTSFLRPTASAYSSQEPSRLSTIEESLSSESPPISYSSPSSRSLTPSVSMSVTASAEPSPSPSGTVTITASVSPTPSPSPSAPPTVPSPSLRAVSPTTVSTPMESAERFMVALSRTPSSVSTTSSIPLGSDIFDNRSLFEEPLEDVPTEPSLLSSHRTVLRAISPASVPLPRTPSLLSMPSASMSVSTSSPRGSVPSIHSNLVTIPSEIAPSERAPIEQARSERSEPERPSVIITDDVNRLLQYLHGVENDRQRDNQGVHDHLGDIQNELRNLADYIHDKDIPQVVQPPVQPPSMQLKDRSVGGSSVVSFREPRGAPDYPSKPPTVTGKASPQVIAIPLTPPPRSPRSPSSLSSSISFLSSHHSDDDSLMESEPLESEPVETEFFETEPDIPKDSSSPISSSPISYSPPSSSISSSPSSSASSEILPLTPITRSPPSSGEYLSRTSSDATRRVFRSPSWTGSRTKLTPCGMANCQQIMS